MRRVVHSDARRRDRSGPEDRFDAQHQTGGVLNQSDVVANQLPQRPHVGDAMEHGAERSHSEQIGETIGIDAIVLVSAQVASPPDHNALDVGMQEIVNPLRLRSFLERHVYARTCAADHA